LIDIEGRKNFKSGTIFNPDWQWRQFIKTGKFYGTCGENTTVENMLAKSIGISCYHGFIFATKNKHIYTHTIIRYYNPIDGMLKTTPFQIYFYRTTGHESSPPVSHDGWIYLPWDNFHRFKNIHNFEVIDLQSYYKSKIQSGSWTSNSSAATFIIVLQRFLGIPVGVEACDILSKRRK